MFAKFVKIILENIKQIKNYGASVNYKAKKGPIKRRVFS
jgi:hypothetical protein